MTDYNFGTNSTLLFSSAEVLTYANLDVNVLVFYLNVGQKGTFVFKDEPKLAFQTYGNSNLTTSESSYGTQYSYTQGKGVTAVKFSNGVLAYFLDKESAWNFFAPPTTSSPQVAPTSIYWFKDRTWFAGLPSTTVLWRSLVTTQTPHLLSE